MLQESYNNVNYSVILLILIMVSRRANILHKPQKCWLKVCSIENNALSLQIKMRDK